MILEALVTTTNEDGTTNLSPMGPQVPESGELDRFQLRPFETSRTCANLRRSRQGVLHVTDDVELIALTAIGKLQTLPTMIDAETIDGKVVAAACRAYEFEVDFVEQTGPRLNLNCQTKRVHRLRDFWGFNRAKHAVIEAAILSTRIDFLPVEAIKKAFVDLESQVIKTGGEAEKRSFGMLNDYVSAKFKDHADSRSSC